MLLFFFFSFFFFNDTATTEIYTLSLHDALPISPAAPAVPRCSRPPRMVARPRPTPSQTRTKSSAPAAAPSARSAIAPRFTSFSITTGLCQAFLSASSAPSCQAGRFTASLGSPVRGSTTPGLPITSALSLDLDPGARAGPLDGTADQFDRILAAVRVAAHLGHRAAGDVGYGRADQVGLDVQARHVGAGRDDRVERGVGAAAPRLLARDRHQAAFFQPGQHLRHRDLGHPGVLADLGSGEH